MANTVPDVAPRVFERALERIKLRANSNGECFGGEIMESLREAGVDLGAHHAEILQTRSVLVRTMESLGEAYPAETLQDYDNRIQLSKALRFLNAALEWATDQRRSGQDVTW
jgi:HD superfamily phosphodiesterase